MVVNNVLNAESQGISANTLAVCLIIFSTACFIFVLFSCFSVYSSIIKNKFLIFNKPKVSFYNITFASIMVIFDVLAITLVCQYKELKEQNYLIIILSIALVLLISSAIFSQIINHRINKTQKDLISDYKNIDWKLKFQELGAEEDKNKIIKLFKKTTLGIKMLNNLKKELDCAIKNKDKYLRVESIIIFNEKNISNWNYFKNKLNALMTTEALMKYAK